MIEGLGGVTSQLISVALDATLLRHEVIANNIANVDTPGFQVQGLSFEDQLRGFTDSISEKNDQLLQAEVKSLAERLHEGDSLIVRENEKVELDREMVKLAENTVRYQALLKASAKRDELLTLAINGGRK
jgi:flagellar basal-body rod protein FlgB